MRFVEVGHISPFRLADALGLSYLRLHGCPANRHFLGGCLNGSCLGGRRDSCIFFIFSTIIMMFSISQSSQRLTSSPHDVPLPKSQHVHFITASGSSKPTLHTKPCCHGEEDHERRQSCAILSCEAAINVPTQLHQHAVIPALRPNYRTVGLAPSSFSSGDSLSSWSGIREEEISNTDVGFNSPARQDPLSSHLDPDLFSVPPLPSDLSALHDTWEHVRAYCNNMMTVGIYQIIQSCSTHTEKHRL